MQSYITDIRSFLRRRSFTVPPALALALSFGLRVTTVSLSVDDLARPRYIDKLFFSHGRFGGPLFMRLLHIAEMYPFAEKLLGVLLLAAAAVILCVVWKRASRSELPPAFYPVFACLFVSFPLIPEIWSYSAIESVIALGFCFLGGSLLLVLDGFEQKRFRLFPAAVVLSVFSISYFESLAPTYVCAVFAILLLRFLYGRAEERTLGGLVRAGLVFAGVLLAGVLLKTAIAGLIRTAAGIARQGQSQNQIMYGKMGLSFVTQFLFMVKSTLLSYFIAVFYYFPITLFAAAQAICLLVGVILAVKRRSATVLLPVFGMMLSCFLLGVVQGLATPYRAAQPHMLFTAFVLSLSLILLCKVKLFRSALPRSAAGLVMALLILAQCMNTNQWFSLNYLRSEEEKQAIIAISQRLYTDFDTDKPVVFVGDYPVSDHLYTRCCTNPDRLGYRMYAALLRACGARQIFERFPFTQTCVTSCLGWGVSAFDEPNTMLLEQFAYYGYDFLQGTVEQYNRAVDLSAGRPAWPGNGCIFDAGDMTVVKLGECESNGKLGQ